MTTPAKPFWQTKTLKQMTPSEWESLCDGCGKCCLNKIEDEDTGEILFTSVACRFLCLKDVKCIAYEKRTKVVKTCLRLTPKNVGHLEWLPSTCAYRLVHQGEDLPAWHHLKSASEKTVHKSGNSVKGKAISESHNLDLTDYIAEWPR